MVIARGTIEYMSTYLYLDSGDPQHTHNLLERGVLLAGQTTNPSLVVRHPEVAARVEQGEYFTKTEINALYKQIVQEIALLVEESVSLEVYANCDTSAREMLEQGWEMNGWIDNAHIKLPTTPAGLKAGEQLVADGIRVNFTLCFTQEQAAAVASVTAGASPGQVLLSPFVGRLDDKGKNGMDLIHNIQRMYQEANVTHVRLLAASIRTREHLFACYASGVDIITAPYDLLVAWSEDNFPMPDKAFNYDPGLIEIPYEEHDVHAPWQSFSLQHPLVTAGVEAFAEDWDAVLGKVARPD